MEKADFIAILKREGIACKIDFMKNDVTISVLGNINKNVFLQTLTSLPENVQFNNDGLVYLPSLNSLSESTQFNNGVYVYLPSLKSLPEHFQFNNGGSVYLHILKSLPENVQFNNAGDVDLISLKSLPESTQFNNCRHVYLRSLKSLPESTQFNNGGIIFLNGKKLKPKEYVFPIGNKRKNEAKDLYKILSKFFEYNYPIYSGSSITCLECKSEYWLSGSEFKANIDNGLKKVFIHKSGCQTHNKLMKEIKKG